MPGDKFQIDTWKLVLTANSIDAGMGGLEESRGLLDSIHDRLCEDARWQSQDGFKIVWRDELQILHEMLGATPGPWMSAGPPRGLGGVADRGPRAVRGTARLRGARRRGGARPGGCHRGAGRDTGARRHGSRQRDRPGER